MSQFIQREAKESNRDVGEEELTSQDDSVDDLGNDRSSSSSPELTVVSTRGNVSTGHVDCFYS